MLKWEATRDLLLSAAAQPAVDCPAEQGADDRGDPEAPQLLDGPNSIVSNTVDTIQILYMGQALPCYVQAQDGPMHGGIVGEFVITASRRIVLVQNTVSAEKADMPPWFKINKANQIPG